jgi:hypothetical protein
MPKQPADYRKYAEECVQLAQAVRTPQQRTMLLHIAETWLRLADDGAQSAEAPLAPAAAAASVNGSRKALRA